MDGRQRQTQIYVDGVAGARPAVPIDFELLEQAAREAMSEEAFAYVRTGAGRERAIAAMGLAGRRSRSEIDRDSLVMADELPL